MWQRKQKPTPKKRLEQWAETTREEFPQQLKAAAAQLRAEVAGLEDELGEQAQDLAHEIEVVAQDLEKRVERRLEHARTDVQENPWIAIFAALGVGIVIGYLLRNLGD